MMKKRILSARPTYQLSRPRPFSGTSRKTSNMIDKTYLGKDTEPVLGVSPEPVNQKRISVNIGVDKPYQRVSQQTKKRQEKVEQIQQLKQTVNRLVEELARERLKTEVMRKKSNGYSRIMTMQFENEQHWQSQTVNNHLVAGIKAKYFKLKQQFQVLGKKHNQLLATVQASNFLQMQAEIDVLREANRHLNQTIMEIVGLSRGAEVESKVQKQAQGAIVIELRNENARLREKQAAMEMDNMKKAKWLKEKLKQLQFQQKLVIEKQNERHGVNIKNKRLLKQLNQFKTQVQSLKDQNIELKGTFQLFKVSSSQHQIQLKESCLEKIQRMLQEKEKKIEFLQRHNFQLQETIAEYRRSNEELKRQVQHYKQEKIKRSKSFHEKQTNEKSIIANTEIQNALVSLVGAFDLNGNVNAEGKRVPQRADRRHHANAQKKRKVKESEVADVAELMKYKMIAQKISLESLKQMFTYKKTQQKEENVQWSEQYLTMDQTTKLLSSPPLGLNLEKALLMSRYMIEDANEDYVYCDGLNENHRSVVKSILKTLIQEYPILQGSQTEEQAQRIIDQYGSNLQNALETFEPSGFISKSKFSGVLRSLGIQTTQQVEELLLGRMAVLAEDIGKLPYKALF